MRDWQRYLNENQDRFRSELQAFVAIPSVSAQPAHADDVRRAGHWVLDRLTAAGMENARMMETGGHPVVYADWRHAPGRPTILIYGHFDVQPAEPLELWDTPPFEPVIRDGRLFGRGASDDKGGMLIPILALEAMLRAGSLGVNVKCLFEGQEEIGSPDLPGFMASHRDMFATDMIFSADGAQWSETEPALLMGTKGLVGFEITITATDEDKHSGVAGAVVANPLMAMAHVLAGMKDARTGRVLIDGFYDNVADLSAEERAQIARIPHDDAAFARQMGAVDVWGEDGFTTLERMGTRPSLDVNGMHGGYQGDGTKTVHPARAVAKLSCRLVPGQTPEDIFAKVQQHLARHTPAGVRLSVDRLPGSALPFGLPEGHNATRIARDVLAEVYGTEPLPIRVGGSLPILPVFLQELGVHTVGFAFALMDERQHAPNEFFRLSSFEKGQVAYCRLFEALAQKT